MNAPINIGAMEMLQHEIFSPLEVKDILLSDELRTLEKADLLRLTRGQISGRRRRLKQKLGIPPLLTPASRAKIRKIWQKTRQFRDLLKVPPNLNYTEATSAILALDKKQCRYIFGDSQHLGIAYCQRSALKGAVYCEAHHFLCHEQEPDNPDSAPAKQLPYGSGWVWARSI